MIIYGDDMMMEGSFEGNQDGGHIVTSDAGHGIGGDKPLEQIFDDFLAVFLFDVLFDDIYDALVVVDVVLPNPITT